MIQEDKYLLLKDICSRIPHRVKGRCEIDASYDTSFDTIFQIHKFDAVVYGLKENLLLVTPLIEDKDEQEFANEEVADGVDILDFKPYLFPMTSMTDEQKTEWDYIDYYADHHEAVDWLNKNYFDYRGLIDMGLALDATNLNIY